MIDRPINEIRDGVDESAACPKSIRPCSLPRSQRAADDDRSCPVCRLSWVPRGQALNASASVERFSQIELGTFRMRYRSQPDVLEGLAALTERTR